MTLRDKLIEVVAPITSRWTTDRGNAETIVDAILTTLAHEEPDRKMLDAGEMEGDQTKYVWKAMTAELANTSRADEAPDPD